MSLAIRLLGKPAIERDGAATAPPRGRKAWALLAYLLLTERAHARAALAELLFSQADDPLGALRWSLAELRRALAQPTALRGDPLSLELPPETAVDVRVVIQPPGEPGLPREALGGELLAGMSFDTSPAFEVWLLVERRRLDGACEALLHQAALGSLSAGRAGEAAELAARAVALNPLEQSCHELLIRCLARGGQPAAAERQLTASERLLRRELGVEPSPELRRAAGGDAGFPPNAVGDPAVAAGQLEAGRAALSAGAIQPGLDCLRLACAESDACADQELAASSLLELGTALVHAVRGRDEEGAAILQDALGRAEAAGDRAAATSACRELGYVDVQAGRYASAGRWLTRATRMAEGDEELAAVLRVRGMALSDRAHYAAALRTLEGSVARADRCGSVRQAAFSLSLIGRVRLLRDELDEARSALDRSLELVDADRWLAFLPWPETLRAQLLLREGRLEEAGERLDHAFSLSCRLADPCWEGSSARAIGLLHAARGDLDGARRWLVDARAHASRTVDSYQWVRGWVLDALAGVVIDADAGTAYGMVEDLEALATRAGMRELVVRAHLHRARLGDGGALEAARLLAAEIENPLLEAMLEESSAPV